MNHQRLTDTREGSQLRFVAAYTYERGMRHIFKLIRKMNIQPVDLDGILDIQLVITSRTSLSMPWCNGVFGGSAKHRWMPLGVELTESRSTGPTAHGPRKIIGSVKPALT